MFVERGRIGVGVNVTLEQMQEAIRNIRATRERVLRLHRTDAIVEAIARTAQSWLKPSSPWRQQAIEQAPAVTGFSPAMVEEIIARTFGGITEESLNSLLDRELGDRHVLDEFQPHGIARAKAQGPVLITHLLAGNVPPPGVLSIVCGLLLKSANLVRASSRDTVFPRLFVDSLRTVDADLGACTAVLEWPKEEATLTQKALNAGEAVIAYGDDSTITAVRRQIPAGTTFLGYGQKVSFAFIAREAMTEANLPALAAAAAEEVSVYDQQGCLSPHVFYVEERGALGPQKFAAALAEAMAAFHFRIPRGTLSVEEASAVTLTRSSYEFRAASDRCVAVWASQGQNDWTVIYEDDPSFSPSCLNRVVFVKPTRGTSHVLEAIQRYRMRISTVGVAPMSDGMTVFAAELGALGIHRVCPIGQMQRPPLWWYHDGRPNIADLVRWTELGV
jgi:hypothetical protein